MAFGFLKDVVGTVGDIVGIARGFSSPDQPESLPALTEAANRANAIALALGQPDLGQYGHLIDENQDRLNRDAAQALRDIKEADRRMRVRSASGRGILPDDRRDEIVTRALIRERQSSRERARDAARKYLTGALQANNIAMGGFTPVVNAQQGMINQQEQRRSNAYAGLFEGASSLLDRLDSSSMLNGTPTRLNVSLGAPMTYRPPMPAQPTQPPMTYRPPFTSSRS